MVAVWKASDKRICSITECISLGSTPHVTKTVTENLAHLVAFARACEWALSDPDARGAPIIIRYVRDYAANVATGLWRPRKHKPMAAAAQSAFRALRTQREGEVWIEYVNPTQSRAAEAARLAARGKAGENSDSRALNVD